MSTPSRFDVKAALEKRRQEKKAKRAARSAQASDEDAASEVDSVPPSPRPDAVPPSREEITNALEERRVVQAAAEPAPSASEAVEEDTTAAQASMTPTQVRFAALEQKRLAKKAKKAAAAGQSDVSDDENGSVCSDLSSAPATPSR